MSGNHSSKGIPLKRKKILTSIVFIIPPPRSHISEATPLASDYGGAITNSIPPSITPTRLGAKSTIDWGKRLFGIGTVTGTVLNIFSGNPQPYPPFNIIQFIFRSFHCQISHTHNQSLTGFPPLCADNYFTGIQPSPFDPFLDVLLQPWPRRSLVPQTPDFSRLATDSPILESNNLGYSIFCGLFWYIGIPELKRSISNISLVKQGTWKATVAATEAQQKALNSLAQGVLQNRRALDVLTAEAGVLCSMRPPVFILIPQD